MTSNGKSNRLLIAIIIGIVLGLLVGGLSPAVGKAVRFIGGELKHNPDADKSKIIEEASRKFDLNPMQTEFLINKFIFSS